MKKWDKDDYHKEKENYINKEKNERSFSYSKNNHGYRYARYKGIERINIIHGLFVLRKIKYFIYFVKILWNKYIVYWFFLS